MEIEAKYRLLGPLTPEDLDALGLGAYRLQRDAELALDDTLLDTPERAVTATGSALRLRRDGTRTLVTFKGKGTVRGAVHSRQEYEAEVSGEPLDPASWPPEIQERVLALAGTAPLEMLAQVRNLRRTWRVLKGDATIGELALDEGVIVAGQREAPFHELELELKDSGSEADLHTLDGSLRRALALEPEPRSKLARALALLDERSAAGQESLTANEENGVAEGSSRDATPAQVDVEVTDGGRNVSASPSTEKDSSKGEQETTDAAPMRTGTDAASDESQTSAETPEQASAEASEEPKAEQRPGQRSLNDLGRDIVRRQLEKLHEAEPVAREGSDLEGVHDMRVASRRLRAALGVMEEAGADPAETSRFRKGLRRLANSLGGVRDLDVFLEHLQEYRAQQDTASADGKDQDGGLDLLVKHLTDRRRVARKEMLRALNAKQTRRLLRQVQEWAEEPEDDDEAEGADDEQLMPTPSLVRHVVRSVVWRRYEEVLAYEQAMPAPALTLHQLRISGKRLRYTLEFFQDALGERAKGLLRDLIAVQDHLGDLQDAEVAIAETDRILAKRRNRPDLVTYRLDRDDRRVELMDTFAPRWKLLSGNSFTRRISEALRDV